MLNNITNFFNLITGRKIKNSVTIENTDLIPLGTRDPRYDGSYQPTAVTYEDLKDAIVSSLPPSEVNYGNVFFVDSTNGNDYTGAQNDFNKPFLNVYMALVAAAAVSPTSSNRSLVYVRKGTYVNQGMQMENYVDVYCEPGVLFTNSCYIYDTNVSKTFRFYGKACFELSYPDFLFKVTGNATDAVFECDEIITTGWAFEAQNGANVIFKARKVTTQTINSANGIFNSGSGTRVIEISQEFSSAHMNFKFPDFQGTAYITCPKVILNSNNFYGGFWKQCVFIENPSGVNSTIIMNANLYCNSTAGYYGSASAIVTRWNNSVGTFILNGNIYAENQLGIMAQGNSAPNRTIINGDIKTNFQVAYVAQSANVVLRNGTLLNLNTESGASLYPLVHVNQNGVLFVENCHLYTTGAGGTSAFTKSSTTSEINVYNSVYSSIDTTGYFIDNTAAGTPVNNVRIHNCRSTKPLDTNITDILSPTGLIVDTNIKAINFL